MTSSRAKFAVTPGEARKDFEEKARNRANAAKSRREKVEAEMAAEEERIAAMLMKLERRQVNVEPEVDDAFFDDTPSHYFEGPGRPEEEEEEEEEEKVEEGARAFASGGSYGAESSPDSDGDSDGVASDYSASEVEALMEQEAARIAEIEKKIRANRGRRQAPLSSRSSSSCSSSSSSDQAQSSPSAMGQQAAAITIQAAARGRVGRRRGAACRLRHHERAERAQAASVIQRTHREWCGARAKAEEASRRAASLQALRRQRTEDGAARVLQRSERGRAARASVRKCAIELSDLSALDVSRWMEASGLAACAGCMASRGIDGAVLEGIEGEAELLQLGIHSRLHRARLLALVTEARVSGVRCPWGTHSGIGAGQRASGVGGDGDAYSPCRSNTGGSDSVFADDFEAVDDDVLLRLLLTDRE